MTFTIFEILNFANSRNGENLNFAKIGVAEFSILFKIDLKNCPSKLLAENTSSNSMVMHICNIIFTNNFKLFMTADIEVRPNFKGEMGTLLSRCNVQDLA